MSSNYPQLKIVFTLLFFFLCVHTASAATTISKSLSRPVNNLGLVGWWTMDGPDTLTNIADKSGQGNTGLLSHGGSGTTTAPGKVGQALSFDGSDDYVNPAETSGLPVWSTAGYSVGFWVKGSLPTGTNQVVYGEGSGSSGNPVLRLQTGTSEDGFLVFIRNDSAVIQLNKFSTTPVFDNKWHHVVWTDLNGAGKLYIDGAQDASDFSYTPSTYTLTKSAIGALDRTSVSNYFNGLIDDVRLYNRVLSTAEITQLYNLGATSKIAKTLPGRDSLTSGLVGWWTFDGPDMLTNIADKSGQGNNGSLSHAGSGTTTAPGPIGQALSFDGTNDFASTTNTNFPDTSSSDYTVAVWVKPSSIPGGSNPRIFVYATDATNGIKLAFGGANCTANFIFEPKKAGINYGGCATTTTFSVNTWYHLVGVFKSSTNTVTFYVNNAVQTTSSFAGGLPSTTGVGYIGVSNAASFFPGSLDDLRVYNRALSAAEVLQLYNLGR